jgi:hypothetical protein
MAVLPESSVGSPMRNCEPSRSDDQEPTAAAELVIMLESTPPSQAPTGAILF